MQIVKFDVKLSVIGLRFKVKWSNIEQCLILLKSLHWSNFISRDWSRVCGSWSQNIHNIRPGGVKHGVQRQHFTDNQHLLGNSALTHTGSMASHNVWSLMMESSPESLITTNTVVCSGIRSLVLETDETKAGKLGSSSLWCQDELLHQCHTDSHSSPSPGDHGWPGYSERWCGVSQPGTGLVTALTWE